MIVSPAFAGKSYAVLGLARSGLATVQTLANSGARVIAWDTREEARNAVAAIAELADPLTIDLSGLHGVVVSPGVPLNRHPIATAAAKAGVPIIGDIELFALARPSLPPHRVVGITGTNGKSTTTALVHHLCHNAGLPSTMGGNIGLPVLGQAPLEPSAAGTGVYVLELSSYQLDLTRRLACDIAVLLNITPDHLDRYSGFPAYAASKARLLAMQVPGQLAVVDYDSRADHRVLEGRGEDSPFLVIDDVWLPGDQADWPSLQGPHNRENAAAAVAVARALGLDDETIARGLASFVGLPHRMERVAEEDGVLYVNDSKATNPASTAPALAAFPRIHWIVGGLPKGDELDECAPFFGNVLRAYTIGEAGPKFADLLEPQMPVWRSEMLFEAVAKAMDLAEPGDVIMLSPACASFDQFRDFAARGDAFRDIVHTLIADRSPAPQARAGRLQGWA